MAFYNHEYPYTDPYRYNMDWLLKAIEDLRKTIADITNQEQFDEINKKIDELYSLISQNMLPATNQIESIPSHTTVYQKQVAMLDDNGQVFGSSININDIMLKPRKPAKNALAFFDNNGNLCPGCFSAEVPILSTTDLLLESDETVMRINYFADTTEDSFIEFKNGLKIAYGRIHIIISEFTTAGSLYRANITLNHPFYNNKQFIRTPQFLLGPPDNLDNLLIIAGLTGSVSGIVRAAFLTYQNNEIDAYIRYLAIGY